MRFTFKLSKADYVAFQALVLRRLTKLSGANIKLFFINLFAWIPIGIAFAAYAVLYRKYPVATDDLTVIAIAFEVGWVLMSVGYFYRKYAYRKAMFSQQGRFLSEQELEISEEGILVRGYCSEASFRWPAIIDFAEDNKNLYLFIDNAEAILLPKAALTSSEQLSQIKAWLRTR